LKQRTAPEPTAISTLRLVLDPISEETATAVIAGDLSSLTHAAGWPHEDTLDGLELAVGPDDRSLVWLVTLDGVVIGDCGTVGLVDGAGEIEIGYGLAAEHRGLGYGNELVAGLSQWLLAQPSVGRVVARGVLAGNVPSRRALAHAGFVCEAEADGLTWYGLDRRAEIRIDHSLEGIDWAQAKADLAADDFDNGRSPEALRRSFERSQHIVFARDGDRVVGMARALSDGVCNAYLLDLWTASPYRRRGIASSLVRRLLEQLPGQHLGLQTDAAQALYESLGFRRQPEFWSRVSGTWLDNDANL
jgi:RimJ/RimL family protein N-acetyltransferase